MQITPDDALREYGISCEHEKMANGELRFRLKSAHDGTAYIRTVAVPESGWQKSHYHKYVRETYIVQRGWMALASLRNGKRCLERFNENDIVTTDPEIPHNVYLPANAVIHTVKHGYASGKDWHESPGLDELVLPLKGDTQVLAAIENTVEVASVEVRYKSYVDVYNNLDKLLWAVPGFFIAVTALLLGFVGSILSKRVQSLPSVVWSAIFAFVAVLFGLGTYSMWRIRFHHRRMDEELKKMEPDGYFHARSETAWQWFPPSAPHLFMIVFGALSFIFLWLAYQAYFDVPWLLQILQVKTGSNP